MGDTQTSLPLSLLCLSHCLLVSRSNITSPFPFILSPLAFFLTPSVRILPIFAQLKQQPLTVLHLRLDHPPPLFFFIEELLGIVAVQMILFVFGQISLSTMVAAGIGKKDLGTKKTNV